jgi:protein-arginine kinase activator protein McsA
MFEMLIIGKKSIRIEFLENGEMNTLLIDHEENQLMRYIDHIVSIEPDVTVKDIFMHMGKEAENIDNIFDASLGGHSFHQFLSEAMEEPEIDPQLSHGLFMHHASVDSGELLHDIRFVVMGQPDENNINMVYNVELCAINTYSNLVVQIDKDFTIMKTENIDNQNIEVPIFSVAKPMTLYDIFSALLFEVSFHGSPEQRSDTLELVKKEVFDIIGTEVSIINTDKNLEFDLMQLENKLEKSINDEAYETSALLRDKIKDLKIQLENETKKTN